MSMKIGNFMRLAVYAVLVSLGPGLARTALAVSTIEPVTTPGGKPVTRWFASSVASSATVTNFENSVDVYTARTNEFQLTPPGAYRVSFDPCENSPRVRAQVLLVGGGDTNEISFGWSETVPVHTSSVQIAFKMANGEIGDGEAGQTTDMYKMIVRLTDQVQGTVNYLVGIRSDPVQVTFDPDGNLGKLPYDGWRQFTEKGLNYTVGQQYGWLPAVTPYDDTSEFLGWTTNRQSGGGVRTTDLASAEVTQLFARWRYPYQVLLHESETGGRTNVVTLKANAAEPQKLPADPWLRSGFAVVSWTNAEGVAYAPGQALEKPLSASPTETNRLYAVWKDKRSWVQFDTSGGVGTMAPQSFAYDEPFALNVNVLTKLGCGFGGWATNSPAAAVAYADGATVPANAFAIGTTNTLYALWRNSSGVVRIDMPQDGNLVTNAAFSSQNKVLFAGRLSSAQPTAYLTVTNANLAADSTLRVSVDPQQGARRNVTATVRELKDGAWETVAAVSDLSNGVVNVAFATNGVYRFELDGKGLAYDYVLGVGFEGVAVVYDLTGGEPYGPEAMSLGTNFTFSVDTPYGYLPAVTRQAWHLTGWSDAPVGGSPCGSNDTVSAARSTLYAQWRLDPFDYRVLFTNDCDGVSGTMGRTNAVYHVPFALPKNRFSRTGFAFDGWYCPSNGCRYADGATVSNLTETAGAEVPLVAQWQGVLSYVRFDPNGGEGTAATVQQVRYGTQTNLVFNKYVRLGYEFAGWATNRNDQTVTYADGAVVTGSCAVPGKTNELFAVWTPDPGLKVYEHVDGRTFADVNLSTNESVMFTGTVTNQAGSMSFAFTVAKETTCRLSLDPYLGLRRGAMLTVTPDATNLASYAVSDRPTNETVAVFATGTVYAVSVTGAVTNGRYAVGLGLPGAQVTFAPCRSVASDKTTQLTLNCSSRYFSYGWQPTLQADATYGDLLGWFDAAGTNGTQLVLDDTVQTNRTQFFARWTKQTWQVTFDWNLSESNVVETAYYANGEKIGTRTPPSHAKGTLLAWNTAADGSGATLTATNTVTSNLRLFAQWYGDYTLVESGGGWVIAAYHGEEAALVIPSELIGKPVVGIGDRAFAGMSRLVSVEIPSSVTSIGDSAFEGCTSLLSVVFNGEIPDEDAETGYLDDEITIGSSAFAGCTSLLAVKLPLGVRTLPDGLFSGCSSLLGFEAPFTVTEIGEEAFADCTAAKTIVVPEKIETIGARAFGGCSGLTNVVYLGQMPEDVADDIYEGTPRTLVSRHYAVATNSWPDVSQRWPGEDLKTNRRQGYLSIKQYPLVKVTFVPNGVDSDLAFQLTKVNYVSGRPFVWQKPEVEDDGFGGWWTEKVGGRKVGPYAVMDKDTTVYAHWGIESEAAGDRAANVHWEDGLYADDGEEYAYKYSIFRGLVLNDKEKVVGTFELFAEKGTHRYDEEKRNATVTGTFRMLGVAGSLSVSGKINPDFSLSAKGGGWQLAADCVVQAGFEGRLTKGDDELIVRGVNQCTEAVRENKAMKWKFATGPWAAVLKTGDVEDLGGAAWAKGYGSLAVSVSKVGRLASIVGKMADGSSVTQSVTPFFGDGYCCIPIFVPLYAGQTGFGCALWITWQEDMQITADDVSLVAMSDWDASKSATAAFKAEFDEEGSFAARVTKDAYVGGLTCSAESVPEIEDVQIAEDFLPKEQPFEALKTGWKFPGRDVVKLIDGEWVNLSEDAKNPSGIKLSLTSSSARFHGQFTVRGWTSGRSFQRVAMVDGVFVARPDEEGSLSFEGYGTATVPKVGSIPIVIFPSDD